MKLRTARSQAAKAFRALGDDTRLQILALLGVREACVCELVDVLGMSQPAISEHLRRLRDVGLVADERRGTWVFYRRTLDLPTFVQAALQTIVTPSELLARLAATTAASACGVATHGISGPDAPR